MANHGQQWAARRVPRTKDPGGVRRVETLQEVDVQSRLERNLIANYAGRAWSVASVLVFVPLYVRFLGVETYGLVGFYNLLYTLLAVADMGLSSTLGRELARLSVVEGSAREMRDLARTLEIVFLAVAALLVAFATAVAPVIVHHWLAAGNIPERTLVTAVRLMGVAIGLQFLCGLPGGGLMGLQRHVQLNLTVIGTGLGRGLGTVFVLWLVSPTIQAYFALQIATNAAQLVLLVVLLWRSLPVHAIPAGFQMRSLGKVWRYAAGMSGIGLTSVILLQLDKAIAVKLLPLEVFGYYSLAGSLASLPNIAAGPMCSAILPRFTQLASLGADVELSRLYHRASQAVSVGLLPTMVTVAVFSREIAAVWLGEQAAEHVHGLVALLAFSSGLMSMLLVPYALQLAHGWTGLSLSVNAAAIILFPPLLLVLIQRHGAIGAATACLALNSGYFLVQTQIMYTRLLKGERRRWYLNDVGLPFVAALAVVLAGRLWTPPSPGWSLVAAWIFGVWLVSCAAALLAADQLRPVAMAWCRRIAVKVPASAR
jgi:O-antigen/teichoic acid export membrane protein